VVAINFQRDLHQITGGNVGEESDAKAEKWKKDRYKREREVSAAKGSIKKERKL